MNAPPAYPRIPHLVRGRGTSDDRVLAASEAELLLTKPVIVEEKLDGANVAVWLENDRMVEVLTAEMQTQYLRGASITDGLRASA